MLNSILISNVVHLDHDNALNTEVVEPVAYTGVRRERLQPSEYKVPARNIWTTYQGP